MPEASKSAWKVKDWVLAFDGSVSGEQARIETTEATQVSGFVIDFRFNEKSEQLKLTLPGAEEPLVFLAKGESTYSASMEKIGAWNRVEAMAVDGRVQLLLNGKSHELSRPLGKGTISVTSSGPIELANIFVR